MRKILVTALSIIGALFFLCPETVSAETTDCDHDYQWKIIKEVSAEICKSEEDFGIRDYECTKCQDIYIRESIINLGDILETGENQIVCGWISPEDANQLFYEFNLNRTKACSSSYADAFGNPLGITKPKELTRMSSLDFVALMECAAFSIGESYRPTKENSDFKGCISSGGYRGATNAISAVNEWCYHSTTAWVMGALEFNQTGAANLWVDVENDGVLMPCWAMAFSKDFFGERDAGNSWDYSFEDFESIDLRYSLSKADLESVLSISRVNWPWQKMNISSLNDIKYYTNLQDLDVSNNENLDISSLADMDLKCLYLDNCNLTDEDMEYIKHMNLQRLSIAGNDITDLSFVKDMDLEYLNINDTKIQDISVLDGKKLVDFRANNTGISDISVLKNMPLVNLSLNGNELSDEDMDIFKDNPYMVWLLELNFCNNNISDISFMEDIFWLHSATLSGNQIKELPDFSEMFRLYALDLSHNQIKDIKALADLKEILVELNLNYNEIEDISPLAETYVSNIHLSHNKIKSIAPLSSMRTPLYTLDISHNQVSDLSPIKKLDDKYKEQLMILDISYNKISSLEPLRDFRFSSANAVSCRTDSDNPKCRFVIDHNNIRTLAYLEDSILLKSMQGLFEGLINLGNRDGIKHNVEYGFINKDNVLEKCFSFADGNRITREDALKYLPEALTKEFVLWKWNEEISDYEVSETTWFSTEAFLEEEDATWLKGDVNLDENVDANDALKILKYVAKMEELYGIEQTIADVNTSDRVDANDSLAILKHVAGMEVFQ